MTGLAAIALVLSVQATAESAARSIERSHIEANVPAPGDFDTLLQRDLDEYFRSVHGPRTRSQYELLRERPTQSGVAYPKFYAWVRVHTEDGAVIEGAVRVAAVERKEFQVTSFLSTDTIKADPAGIYRVFPAPVCERIEEKVKALQ